MPAKSKKTVKSTVTTAPTRPKPDTSETSADSFVRTVKTEFRDQFADTVDLTTFRETASTLAREDKLRLVDQALVLIERNYVHLPLKMAMHATDPVQSLKLLRYQLENDAMELPDLEFHRTMTQAFMSVRDLHTNYILPTPFRGMIAFVPFMIEEFAEDGERHYLVTNISDGFAAPPFEKGVEMVSWNGIPIERAVEIHGNRYAGSNLEARRTRGVATLTVRQLALALPPDENFVLVGYLDRNGTPQEFRTDWLVISAPVSPGEILPPDPREARVAAAVGSDMEMAAVQHVQKLLYAQEAVADELQKAAMLSPSAHAEAATPAVTAAGFASFVPESVMSGRKVRTAGGSFGYIRIRSFSYKNDNLQGSEIVQSYVDRFIELAESLPQNGLIVDVRGNGGGYILAGERLLQLMTPNRIHPEPTQFINTTLNLEICERFSFLTPWVSSLKDAVLTGAQYSRGIPITSPEEANDTGQHYFGPVVLITDALCYSTTDIFAAGFQDHGIGPVIGVHDNTGAGGANVWTHDLLRQFYPSNEPGSPYEPMPAQAGMRVSIRRTMRVLENTGTPVEDLGVKPDHLRPLTRNDILSGNRDLLDFAGSVLSQLPVRSLGITSQNLSSGTLRVTIDTVGLTGCDVFADGRAQGSVDISDGQTQLTVAVGDASMVELHGFAGSEVAAVRRIRLA